MAIPQVIQQVACSYVNITALFLNAHDAWEQAQELTPKGSGKKRAVITPQLSFLLLFLYDIVVHFDWLTSPCLVSQVCSQTWTRPWAP